MRNAFSKRNKRNHHSLIGLVIENVWDSLKTVHSINMKFIIVFLLVGLIGFSATESTDDEFIAPKSFAKSMYHSIAEPIMNIGEQIIERKQVIGKYIEQIRTGTDKKQVVLDAVKNFKESITDPDSEPTFLVTKLVKKIIHRKTSE